MPSRSRRPRGERSGESAGASVTPSLDKYTLYERCVQDPPRMAAFLYAVHGGSPRVMREDFCGSGGICRAWAAMKPPGGRGALRAIGVDQDPEPLERLKGIANIRRVHADVLDSDLKADIISATNFPIGYWHTRHELVRYLKLCRQRLNTGGIFVCDTYGGATAFTRGKAVQNIRSDDLRIRYTWEQREANPMTGRVLDVVHFRVQQAGKTIFVENDAFVYDWRLWSIPELRDAMANAGFKRTEVYSDLSDAVDQSGRHYVRPIEDPDELGEAFVVYIAARP